MKKTSIYSRALAMALVAGGMMLGSCTDSFDQWNTDPNGVTEGEMEYDNLNTGAYFAQMQRGVFPVGKDLGGTYQICQMLTADNFAGYFANIKNSYDIGATHSDHYAMIPKWNDMPFEYAFTNVMQPWKQIVDVTDENSVARAMATVVKVFGMQRITDKYGPIPYTKFGTAVQVPYDTQEEVYDAFFTELDEALAVLTAYTATNSAAYMAKYDNIYSGNVSKWIKFANSLRLRLAMRISYVNQAKATAEAQKAIEHEGGLMSSSNDDAVLHQDANLTFINPIFEVNSSFHDMRMGAMADCYLNGLEDPRLAVYYTPNDNGVYAGVRNGMTNINTSSYMPVASAANYQTTSDLPWMRAAETYFLLAEAKLRLNLGGSEVKDLYEQGVRTSFESYNLGSKADAYLADNEKTPLDRWTNPTNNRATSVGTLSSLTVAWDDAANNSTKLERIMVQKWIALYPDGQEAWSEMRRTGLPGFATINTYNYADGVSNGELVSRLRIPTSEYSNNNANASAAAATLNGADNYGTRLWWDVRR